MVEKQYAEQRLMPVVGNEAAEYGYEAHTAILFSVWTSDTEPNREP